ncbi:hypothetical protein [Solibacillus sp. FSL H8-0538]
MKAAIIQGFLEKMGIQSYYSRPRVSLDFPNKGFETIEAVRI